MQLGTLELNVIHTGDARELSLQIPDNSIDLIFTDPVYERIEDYYWLAQTAQRILKPEGGLLTFCGIGFQEQTQAMLRLGGRPVRWILPIVYSAGNTPRFHPKGFAKWTMLLWAGGEPKETFCDAQISVFEKSQNSHQWTKNIRPLAQYLKAFTKEGDTVADFFTGGGTIPTICKMLGRNFIGFEIDADIAQTARDRLDRTMPLLESCDVQEELFNEGFAAA